MPASGAMTYEKVGAALRAAMMACGAARSPLRTAAPTFRRIFIGGATKQEKNWTQIAQMNADYLEFFILLGGATPY